MSINCVGGLLLLIASIGCKSPATEVQSLSARLSAQLASNLPPDQKLRIGLLPFNEPTPRGAGFAQALHKSLKNTAFCRTAFLSLKTLI